jgi:hypothetical protein
MKIKSILIEKYIEPSETEYWLHYKMKFWCDRYGEMHSLMGQPAEVWYSNGRLYTQYWHKKGVCHRDRDLPAYIRYNSNEQIERQIWYKRGVRHRDGTLPSSICYNNGQINCQEWHKNGELIKSKYYY